MRLLLRIWNSLRHFFCAYFVICMAIPVSFRVVLCLLFLLVRSLDICVTVLVLFRIVLCLLVFLARSLDCCVMIRVLFLIVLCLTFPFARYLNLCMAVLVLFWIILCISIYCSLNDSFSYLFLSISIDFFLIMLVEHLRTPRISLFVYPNMCSYQK